MVIKTVHSLYFENTIFPDIVKEVENFDAGFQFPLSLDEKFNCFFFCFVCVQRKNSRNFNPFYFYFPRAHTHTGKKEKAILLVFRTKGGAIYICQSRLT